MRITNWLKKIRKTENNGLQTDESVEATLVIFPRGTMRKAVLFGAIGGAVVGVAGTRSASVPVAVGGAASASGEAAANADARRNRQTLSGLPTHLPTGKTLLALTNNGRIIAYAVDWRRFKLFPHTVYKASDLRGIEIIKWGIVWQVVRLDFSDGQSMVFDLPRGHDYKKFKRLIENQGK